MPDSSKTEKATPKKREDERKKGNIFQSTDIVSALSLLVIFMILRATLPHSYEFMQQFLTRYFSYTSSMDRMTQATVIDIAKVLAVSAGDSLDSLYAAPDKIEKKRELIILPTTCGTGSEVTNISIINRTRLGTKVGLVSPHMYADEAVLVPELLNTLPFAVFATSSIDALVHAVESSLSPKATPYTKLFGYKAIEMIIRGYQKIAVDG